LFQIMNRKFSLPRVGFVLALLLLCCVGLFFIFPKKVQLSPFWQTAVPWDFRATGLLSLFALAVSLLLVREKFHAACRRKEHRAWQETLQGVRQLNQGLFNGSRDGIVVVDGEERIVDMNRVAVDLSGWKRDKAIGESLLVVFPLIDDTGNRQDELRIVEQSAYSSFRMANKEGWEYSLGVRVVSCGEPIRGAAYRIVSFSDQSSESLLQKRMESRLLLREYAYTHGVYELLHRAMEELAALVSSPRGFCCCLGGPSCAVAVEQADRQREGHSWSWYDAAGEPICTSLKNWLPKLPADVLIVDQETYASQAAKPEENEFEPTCRFGRGREILLPIHRAGRLVAVMILADKAVPYVQSDVETLEQMGAYIWRLVEQKQMEEALLASERRYRTLYRSMMDAFVVTDLGGHIRECNQGYADMLGYTQDELKGKSAWAFTPAKWQLYELEHVRKQLMHGGCSELYEKEYRHRDGRIIPVELRTYLLVNNEGQPEGMSAVVRDISHRKQAEEEREKLHKRLNLAQKLESVGQLAGGVAHDFNNMLSVIIGFAELALRRLDVPAPLDMYLKEIVTAAKRSADVTRQLLAFARQQTIAPRILDLNPILEGMLKMLRRLIGENIELCWLPCKEIWPVHIDPSQIDQILANLCVNARDAISGVGKITIETDRVSFDGAYCDERGGFLPGDFVVLTVSDTGCGIERPILDKMFEPFFTTKAVGQGTGLGLATVYGIVKQNKGFINVYSEPGQGTTFRIYLPRHQGEGARKEAAVETAIPIGQGEVILVVEDEPAMLSLNQTLLEQLNYKVLVASKPGKALLVAREFGRAIDLVLLDVIMPEMNGRDLARELRGHCPDAKILFMSGYTANAITSCGELEEGTSFIAKPFSSEELARKVRETLAG